MAKASEQPLQPNPFRTYRDPRTGLWVVINIAETQTNYLLSGNKKNKRKNSTL